MKFGRNPERGQEKSLQNFTKTIKNNLNYTTMRTKEQVIDFIREESIYGNSIVYATIGNGATGLTGESVVVDNPGATPVTEQN